MPGDEGNSIEKVPYFFFFFTDISLEHYSIILEILLLLHSECTVIEKYFSFLTDVSLEHYSIIL